VAQHNIKVRSNADQTLNACFGAPTTSVVVGPVFSNEVAEWLDRAATRYEIDDEDDQRDDEQQVNQATANVTNESQ
jgi:hypothetical protein